MKSKRDNNDSFYDLDEELASPDTNWDEVAKLDEITIDALEEIENNLGEAFPSVCFIGNIAILSPSDIFNHYITDELFTEISKQTILYFDQNYREKPINAPRILIIILSNHFLE